MPSRRRGWPSAEEDQGRSDDDNDQTSPRRRVMTMRTVPILALAVGGLMLAACGSGSTTTVESASSSGEVAGWGTKGVELTLINNGQYVSYVWLRGSNDVRLLQPGESTTYQGEKSFADDVEIDISWKDKSRTSSPLEVDASNPSMGTPNVSVGFQNRTYTEGESATFRGDAGGLSTVPYVLEVIREGDSDDNKRFTVKIAWSRADGR